MNDEKQLNYWNGLYNKEYFFGSGPTKLANLAESILKDHSIKKILEVGCGQGRDAVYFSQIGYDVDAFDISQNAINFVNQKKKSMNLTNLNAFVHDVEKPLQHPPEYFDFVYSNLALQFFDLKRLEKIFENLVQPMKKNSMFLFSTKKKGDKYYQFGNKINEDAYEHQGIIRYFFDSDALRSVLSKYLEVVVFESNTHTNLDSSVSVWWSILAKKI